MKRSGSIFRSLLTVVFFALAILMAVATFGAVQITSGYVYLPPALLVNEAKVERENDGAWVTLELQNLSSSSARIDSGNFFFYTDDNEWLDVIEQTPIDYTNPFYSGWEPQLPGGRTGTVRFFLPLPQDAQSLRISWYLDDEEQQLLVPLNETGA